MKLKDFGFIIFISALFIPFFVWEGIYLFYLSFNGEHPYIASFIKFAILATSGELAGSRITTGNYFIKGFGIAPRAIVWGFLGISIKIAFVLFQTGSPEVLRIAGYVPEGLAGRVAVAFTISTLLNLFFAPVLMTFHRLTDAHIMNSQGSMRAFITLPDFGSLLKKIDWDMHWGFVLKKSIPLFWIPMQTINFLLPVDFQILVAAILGMVLGIILAYAARLKHA